MRKIQCGNCHKLFVGTSDHQEHRTGSYRLGERRCLTDQQMIARGFFTTQGAVIIRYEGKPVSETHTLWHSAPRRSPSDQETPLEEEDALVDEP